MKLHVLDANALYRYLTGGPGAGIVNGLFKQAREANQSILMSVVNWGEVHCAIAKAEGFAQAARIMDRVLLLPLTVMNADKLVTISAAKLKAGHGLPYADCFAAATAGSEGVLVTADAKDFRKVLWLRTEPLPEHKPQRPKHGR